MISKILNQSQYELLNFPHYTVGDYLGRPFKAVFSKESKPIDRIGFGNGIIAKSLMDFYRKNVNTEAGREAYEAVKRFYDRWILSGCKVRSLEDVYSGVALLDIFEITNNDKYKKGIDAIMSYVSACRNDENGSIIFDQNHSDKYIHVESIGFIVPFLAKYAVKMDDDTAMNLAITQVQNYVQLGMDDKLILPYHGYEASTGIKYGIVGWGLGVGLLMIGMSELLACMETTHPSFEAIKQSYRRIVDKVEAYQAEGGLYHWQLSAKDGPADTGATAMILYSIAQSLENKVLIGIHKSRMMRGVEALKQCLQEDGSIPGASKMTDEFNNYPIDFGPYPWALGPTLSLLVMLNEAENIAVPEPEIDYE